MSGGRPPASDASTPGRPAPRPQGWLTRQVRGVAYFFLRRDFQRLEAGIAAARADLGEALERQSRGIQELREHLETRVNDSAAALEDLRHAYIATRSEFEQVRDARLARLEAAVDRVRDATGAVQREVDSFREGRFPQAESAIAGIQHAAERLQREVESVRDGRMPRVEADVAGVQRALDTLLTTVAGVQALAEELRDGRLPALSARTDALIERLHESLTEVAGLGERIARHEPLTVAVAPEIEARIPAAVAAASTRFADAFRGGRGEILGRAAELVQLLVGAAPVLDLGCGRGELLEALREAGIGARGVDSDPAMAAACRRLGFAVDEGDALSALRGAAPGSLGGVTAIHLVEHLPAPVWMQLVEAAARALRSGGALLIETPNPESLRVGAGLFWADPTHRAPVHPDALAFVAKAVGLEVVETRLLHPFPPEQALARPGQAEPVRELASRLDAWLSGPRDALLVARKP